MRRLATDFGLISLVLSLACSGGPERPAAAASPATLRKPPAGAVVGSEGHYGNHVWRGIPFAQPPVGKLRWRAPQALAAWDGSREALAFGSSCPQFASPIGGDDSADLGTPVGSEDCLFLNVYAPALAPDQVPSGGKRLPVMFWIHGGGNTIGTSAFYNGGNLAASESVVVVTLNYRLGPFGWFRHPSLAPDATPAERSGNFAVLDLIQGLIWVRDNIAAFGGDPDNVTIFGESAGGQNVAMLLASPLSEGLFDRAIVQSGSTRSTRLSLASNYRDDTSPGDENSAQEVALRLLVSQGEASDRAEAKQYALSKNGLRLGYWLRNVPAEDLLNSYPSETVGMYDLPQAMQDGTVLPIRPLSEVVLAGDIHPVPLMLGTNRDENKLFLFLDPKLVRQWFGLLPQVLDEARYEVVSEYQSRSWKADGADEIAIALAAQRRDDVFVYRFDWDEEPSLLWFDLGQLLGASHGFEIPFVFGHFDLGRDTGRLFDEDNLAGRVALSDAMMSYWAQFAYAGDPGAGRAGDLPRWLAWPSATGADTMLVLDTPEGGGARMSPEFVTREGLIADFAADPRLADLAFRCSVLDSMMEWSDSFDESTYASAGCAELPTVAAAAGN